MKNLFSIFTVMAISLTLVGCQDWLDVNTSPDNPTTVTCEVVLPTVLFYSVQDIYDFTEYATYLSQCLTTTGRSTTSAYAYKVGWGGFTEMNRHPQWRRYYFDLGINIQYMREDAERQNKRNYILIGRTLMLNALQLTTDLFGEMAVSEAYHGKSPKYDTQEEIYAYMDKEFQDLLALYDDPEWINCPTNGIINAQTDRMFEGDMGKWRALTKALYARFLLRRLPNWDNTPATCEAIIKAVDGALNDPAWAEPIYKFDGGSAEKNCQWGPSQPKMNLGWAQARDNQLGGAIPSRFFASILGFYPKRVGYSAQITKDIDIIVSAYALDPRADRMMEPRADGSGTKALRSLRNNIGMDVEEGFGKDYKATYFPDLYCTTTTPAHINPYTRDDGIIVFITEEELLFIKAEAQWWAGNKMEAYQTTLQAVERSMQRYSVRGNIGENEDVIIDYFKKMRLPSDNFTLAELMQQKYVAMYLQPEQWNDVRRYNYSSSNNGIQYDGVYVYDVARVHNGKTNTLTDKHFTESFSLTRPYNIYQPHWKTPKDEAVAFPLSANAWLNRISADPETEEKYNRVELERFGAYKNPNWLRKRMIWQLPLNPGGAITNYGEGDWNDWN